MTADPEPANLLLAWAKRYAALGWPVFPIHWPDEAGICSCGKADCGDIGKHPRTAAGFKDATTSEFIVRNWWRRWPDANVGIATGSGLVVLDIDLHSGSGFKTLLDLEAELGKLPHTPTVITGSGGHHRYYRVPAGVVIRNSAGKTGLGPDLDVRGDGGYVVAAPSLHETLTRYSWAPGRGLDDMPIAELPAAWIARLQGKDKPAAAKRVEPINLSVHNHNRNAGLTSIAGALRARGLSEEQIRDGLAGINGHVDEPLPAEDIAKIARSIGSKPAGTNGSKPARYNRTDLGNAERLVDAHGSRFRYATGLGWLVYDGTRWARDPEETVMRRLAQQTVRAIYPELATIEDKDEREALFRHAQQSERSARIAAMVDMARSIEGVAVPQSLFDADPWLFNCPNGTLNLRTGELHPHRPADLLTKLAGAPFEPAAVAPRWAAFLARVMGDNRALTDYLARVAGYSLTALTGEECLWVLYGTGRNGKSKFLEALALVMGDYAATTGVETLLHQEHGRSIPNDVAALAGARFVSTAEPDAGGRLDEAQVKRLTGGDGVSARFLRQEFFTFRPAFKLLLAANHKPTIRGTDEGIWSRVNLVPFTVTIPAGERDKGLLERFRAEAAGILAWAVRGCLEWQRIGLAHPPEVKAATEAYRDEMDVLGPFLAECCTVHPNGMARSGELYKAYADWTEKSGEKPLSQRAFTLRLSERGIRSVKGAHGVRMLAGVVLGRVEVPDEAPPSATRFEEVADAPPDSRLGGASDRDPGLNAKLLRVCEENTGEAPPSATRHPGPISGSVTETAYESFVTNRAEASTPYPGCWFDGCLRAVADIDSESGCWCTEHLERRQLLNYALLVEWPQLDLGGGSVVEGREGWQAFARSASDTEVAFASDALAEVESGS